MGSVYAGLFGSAGHEVWAIDAWQEHVEAIRLNGLRVEGASGDRVVPIRATTDAAEAGEADLVVIATKAMDVEAAAEGARPLVGAETLVLSIQNGLGGPDAAARVLGGGVRGWPRVGGRLRLRRPGHLRPRLRGGDPGRPPVDAARPDRRPPERDRLHQRRDPASRARGRRRRAGERDGHGAREGAR